MTYKIVTKSTFENVYHVEAETEESAIDIVLNSGDSLDFFQKHLGEEITSIEKVNVTREDIVDALRKAGYF